MEGRKISISSELYQKIEKSLLSTKFDSVDAYAEFLLDNALRSAAEEDDYTQEDEEKIQKRLQDLGYID